MQVFFNAGLLSKIFLGDVECAINFRPTETLCFPSFKRADTIPFLQNAETVSASTLESDDCLGFSKGMGRVYINADVAYLLYYTYLVSEKIFTINTNTYN